MSTISDFLQSPSIAGHLRPFDLRRDLARVADLVEICFADTLDPDGERYLQNMRAASRNASFLSWAAEWASAPLTGFVWEEDGRLVGNASLIPYTIQGRRQFLIANVAVHPDYRRRGIARALTARAMEQAIKKGSPSAWLHVRENNDAAIRLYQSLGFVERARRTTWYSSRELPSAAPPPGILFTIRRSSDWPRQEGWLRRSYPPELTWHLSISPGMLHPGPLGFFRRMLNGSYVQQWSAIHNGRLLGVLSWQATTSYANALWLAAPAEAESTAAFALLLYARQHLSPRRPLSLDYPAHRIDPSIHAAGFYPQQTLVWMQASLRR